MSRPNALPTLTWRDCAFVSLSQAEKIAGRAPGWALRAIYTGDLDGRELRTGGPLVVTVDSLARLVDGAQPPRRVPRPANGRPALRVVATNP